MNEIAQIETEAGKTHANEARDGGWQRSLAPRTRLVLLVVVVGVLLGGAVWYLRHLTYSRYFEETNDAQVQADSVQIAPRVSGYVSQVLVADNEDVTAGQPLARIDVRSYRAQAEQARAQIAQSAAGVENIRAGIEEQHAAIDQAQASLASARAKAAYDAGEVARFTPLAASGAETRQQLAQLRLAAAQSAEQVRQLSAALQAQHRRISAMQAQIRQAEAQGQGARAQFAAAAIDVSASLLTAPVSGRVGDRTVNVGQFVQAGTRLMTVVPLENLYVVANFKETQLALMRPGQPVKIAVDALDGHEIDGRVQSVSPGTGAQFSILPPQNATGNFTKIVQRVPVRIAIEATPAARRLLVPGLSVTVTVDTRSARGELDHLSATQDQAGTKER